MDSDFAPNNPATSDSKNLLPLVRQLENSADNAVSPKGAVGRYQITPDTAKTYGLDPSKLTDPEYNEQGAGKIIDNLYKKYQGNTNDVLVAYNAGPGAADKWIANGRRMSQLPKETQAYLTRASDFLQPLPDRKPPAPDETNPTPPQTPGSEWDNKVAQARAAGFSWDEINEYADQKRQSAKAAGYSDAEIDSYFGIQSHDGGAPIPGQETQGQITPKELFDGIGWSYDRIRHVFGNGAADAAIMLTEAWDNRPRTTDDFKRLGQYDLNQVAIGAAENYKKTHTDAETMRGIMNHTITDMSDPRVKAMQQHWVEQAEGFIPEGGAGEAVAGLFKARELLPKLPDVIDAATAITPKGEDIRPAMQALGRHYMETGQHPLEAANENLKLGQKAPGFQRPEGMTETEALSQETKIIEGSKTFKTTREINESEPGVNFERLAEDQKANEILNLGRGDQSVQKNSFRDLILNKQGSTEFTPPETDITPETIGQRNNQLGKGIVDDLRRIFNPAARSDLAGTMAAVTREGLGETAQRFSQSADSLRRFGRVVGQLPSRERLEYLDAIEKGNVERYAGTPLGDLATELRRQFDARWDMLNEKGIAPHYIEDYFPHIWDNPKATTQYFSRRPLGGNKSFTRERTYDTIKEGMANGLKLKTDNPIELSLMQLHQMDRAITEKNILDQLAEAGIGAQMKAGQRAAADQIRLTSRAPGFDNYYVPEHVGTIINRYLSPGLSGRPIYDMLRSSGNIMNMAQLGASGFHAAFVIADAFTSGVAKGIKQLSRGIGEMSPTELFEGAKSLMISPLAPVKNYLVGRQVIRQYLGRQNYGADMQTLADHLVSGGGRIGLDPAYRGSAAGSFWSAFRGSAGSGEQTIGQAIVQMYRDAQPLQVRGTTIAPGFVRATAQIVPRVMDTIMSPIMEHLVPTMKSGMFADLMADEIRANPEMGATQARAVASRLWDSVDNRLGQLVYDNLFWDKTMRDIGHVTVRSLGWNLGTIREIGGGALDFTKGLPVSESGLRQLTDRASYVVALPIATALMGAMYGALKGTWSADWSLRDYFFPKTGGTDAQGGEDRANMPGYFKDVYEWSHHPLQTAENKIHPLWNTVYDMMTNQQWNGAAISDPRGPYLQQAKDYGDFLVHQFEPFFLQQLEKAKDESGITTMEKFLGIREAPYEVREPGQAEKYENKNIKNKVQKKERMDQQNE